MSIAKRSLWGKSEILNLLKDEDKNKDPNTDKIRPIIRFGLKKAKAILEHIPEIEAFVKDIDSSPQPEETDE